MKRIHIAPVTRKYLYRLGLAGVGLMAGYGLMSDDKALLWVAALGPLLGLAERNTTP